MGLLDNFNIDDPRTMGLLSAGFSMMGNSGASRTPVNLGQILSGGLQAYAGTQDEFRKRKQQEAELAQMAKLRDLQMQQNQMQVGQMQSKIEEQAAAKQRAAQLPQLAAKFGNDYQGMIRAGIPVDYVKSLAESKNIGRPKVARVEDVAGADGGKMRRMYSDFGDVLGEERGYVAPELVDYGGSKQFVTPSSGLGFKKTLTPSDQITLRGQNLADSRSRQTLDQADRHFAESSNMKAKELALKSNDVNVEKESRAASFDTMLDSLDRLSKHKGLNISTGMYSVMPTIPGTTRADFMSELETFQSQAFLPMVSQLKGMGALSDAEGKKLTAAVGALKPSMSEKSFRESLDRIKKDMEAARERAVRGTSIKPRQGNQDDIDDLLKKYGG